MDILIKRINMESFMFSGCWEPWEDQEMTETLAHGYSSESSLRAITIALMQDSRPITVFSSDSVSKGFKE